MSAAQDELARKAFEGVKAVRELDDKGVKLAGRFKTLARKLPAMLQKNGLGQTIAFLYSKAKGEQLQGAEGQLLKLLNQLLLLRDKQATLRDPMERVLLMSPAQYRHNTQQAMVASTWIKRFAEGLIDSDVEEDE